MTRYIVEDTQDGFKLSIQHDAQESPRSLIERGGHGPVEALYAEAQRIWGLRHAHRAGNGGT